MWVIATAAWITGAIIGFNWGLRTALDRPAYARGFLRGFRAPWLWLVGSKEGRDA